MSAEPNESPFRIGDVVLQARSHWSEAITPSLHSRGVVVAIDPEVCIRISAGNLHHCGSFWDDWDVVPPESQTLSERVWSAWSCGRSLPANRQAAFEELTRELLIAILPPDERTPQMGQQPRPSLQRLAAWVAMSFDDEAGWLMPRVLRAVKLWQLPDKQDSDLQYYDTVAWTVFMAFLTSAEQDAIYNGNWPRLPDLAIMAAESAERQKQQRRARIIQSAMRAIA